MTTTTINANDWNTNALTATDPDLNDLTDLTATDESTAVGGTRDRITAPDQPIPDAESKDVRGVFGNQYGLSTIEYAMGTLAAAALAAVLYMIINSDAVSDALEGIINDALSSTPN